MLDIQNQGVMPAKHTFYYWATPHLVYPFYLTIILLQTFLNTHFHILEMKVRKDMN